MRIFVFVFLSFVLFSCSSNHQLRKLQGKWMAAGDLGDGEHSWYMEYEFTGNSYKMTGYPPISESGHIEILQNRGDSVEVTFKVEKSSPEMNSHTDWLVIKDSILYLDVKEFHRIK